MLYEENPKFLSEVFSSLLGENFSGTIGVQFIQQRRSKNSMPDGEIFQDLFSITDLKQISLKLRQQTNDNWYPVRVFVLGSFHSTNFAKTSPGGMQVSKRYFDISKLKVEDAKDLAGKLQDKTWDDY